MASESKQENCSYTWKLPSLTPHEKLLLCYGYTRLNYSKYMILPLVQLFAHFYANETFALSQIINAKVGKRFHGPIISINSFKFYLELYPNGTTSHHAGQVAAFLCIASLPPTVSSIELSFSFELKETDTKIEPKSFVYAMETYWRGLYAETSQIKDTKSLTFEVCIDAMTVNYKNSETNPLPFTVQNMILTPIKEHKPELALWEVTDTHKLSTIHNAPNVFGFSSPIFVINGVKFYMTFYPNGSKLARKTFCNVYLHLASLPKTDMKVNIRHSQGLQGDTHMRSSKFITVFDIAKSSWGLIERSTYATQDLMRLDNFLCVAEIIVLDIFDSEDVCDLKQECCESLKVYSFEWELNDSMMEFIKSSELEVEYGSPKFEMFGLEWNVLLYPCGKTNDERDITIGLKLVQELPKMYTMSVRCTFEIMELKVRYVTTGFFDEKMKDIDWGNGRVLTETIQSLETCTIKISMELVDVYESGVCMTEIIGQMGDVVTKCRSLKCF